MIDADRVLFFGCWEESGHYLRNRHGSVYRSKAPWLPSFADRQIDGAFCPYAGKHGSEGPQNEGEALLHHVEGWTVLAWWDRSVDRRGGSNAAILAPGEHSFADMVDLGQRLFAKVWGRFKYPIRLRDTATKTASEMEIERLRALVVSLGGTP